nr:hypothetical protein HUO10_003700 [Paraburkholderia busanensis]
MEDQVESPWLAMNVIGIMAVAIFLPVSGIDGEIFNKGIGISALNIQRFC